MMMPFTIESMETLVENFLHTIKVSLNSDLNGSISLSFHRICLIFGHSVEMFGMRCFKNECLKLNTNFFFQMIKMLKSILPSQTIPKSKLFHE